MMHTSPRPIARFAICVALALALLVGVLAPSVRADNGSDDVPPPTPTDTDGTQPNVDGDVVSQAPVADISLRNGDPFATWARIKAADWYSVRWQVTWTQITRKLHWFDDGECAWAKDSSTRVCEDEYRRETLTSFGLGKVSRVIVQKKDLPIVMTVHMNQMLSEYRTSRVKSRLLDDVKLWICTEGTPARARAHVTAHWPDGTDHATVTDWIDFECNESALSPLGPTGSRELKEMQLRARAGYSNDG